MSTDLEDKPKGIYDDDEQAALEHNERLKRLEEDFALPAIDDEDRNTNQASSKDIKSSENAKDNKLSDYSQAAKEKSGFYNPKDDSNKAISNKDDSFYKNAGNKAKLKAKRMMSKRSNKIGLAIASALVSGFVALTTMAPSLIINHLKEMLLGRISSVQMYHQRRYRQRKLNRFKNMLSPQGRKAQKIIDEMVLDGYTPIHSNGKIVGLQPPGTRASGIIGTGIGDHIDEYMNVKHPFRTARWKTKRMNALYKTFGVKRSSPVDADKVRAGPDGEINPKKIVNKEIASGVLEGEDPDLFVNHGDKAKTAEEQAKRDATNAEYEEASDEIGEEFKESKAQLIEEGIDEAELPEVSRATATSGGIINDELGEIAERAVSSGGAGSKLASGLKGILNPLDIGDRICTIRNRINGAIFLARSAKAVKLIRYSMLFINAADDTRRGKASSKSMNELMKRVTAVDKNGNGIGASPGFGYMMKSKFSKTRNKVTGSPVAVDGKLTGFMGTIHDATNAFSGVESACPYVQNPAIQIAAGIGSVLIGVFSGGTATAAEQAAIQSSKEIVKKAVKDAIESAIQKGIVKSLLKTLAVELSFEAIMILTEMYIQQSLNMPFTGQEKGGQLGDILVAGAGASNKQRSLSAGMVPATSAEYAQAQTEYLAWQKEQNSRRSFMDRTFAMDDQNTLMFNLALAIPSDGGQFINNGIDKSLSIASNALNPSKVLTSIMTAISPKASALGGDEVSFGEFDITAGDEEGKKLATDPAGNPQMIMRSDIEDIDAEDNAAELVASGDVNPDTLEPIDGPNKFKEHIANCVDTADIYTSIEENKGDCMARQAITKKFKAHLAYIDMLDGFDAHNDPGSISPTSASPSTPTTPTTPELPTTTDPGIIVGDPYTDSTSVPCAAGTRDIGIQDAYAEGRVFKAKLCSLSNMTSSGQADKPGSQFSTPGGDGHAIVNSRVSGAWFKLVNDAKAAGVNLSASSSFRSMPHQQSLWNANPNPEFVARPGHSSHQGGVAIDFGNMSGKVPKATCANRASNSGAGYQWLKANASKYGFKQYAVEAWHWDAYPLANRC